MKNGSDVPVLGNGRNLYPRRRIVYYIPGAGNTCSAYRSVASPPAMRGDDMDFLRETTHRLTEEAKKIEYELRVVLPTEIQAALAHGDISENGEYEAAKERQSTLSARLAQIQQRLADLSRINVTAIPRDRAGLGSRVTVEYVGTGQETQYTLVIPEIADGKKNFVSIASPVGKALLNRRPGDEVTVQAPKGTLEFEVMKVVTSFGDTLE